MKLYLDANVIIDAHEAADPYRQQLLARLVSWCQAPNGDLVTSILARLECRIVPRRNGNPTLLAEYGRFFDGGESRSLKSRVQSSIGQPPFGRIMAARLPMQSILQQLSKLAHPFF